jgi:dynein heavy chain
MHHCYHSEPSLLFTVYFLFYICENSLQELEDFITEADKGLLTPVEKGDYEALIQVMVYLYNVRERQATTDVMFEPIKEIMDMLKPYHVEFSEETYLKLQVIIAFCFHIIL